MPGITRSILSRPVGSKLPIFAGRSVLPGRPSLQSQALKIGSKLPLPCSFPARKATALEEPVRSIEQLPVLRPHGVVVASTTKTELVLGDRMVFIRRRRGGRTAKKVEEVLEVPPSKPILRGCLKTSKPKSHSTIRLVKTVSWAVGSALERVRTIAARR